MDIHNLDEKPQVRPRRKATLFLMIVAFSVAIGMGTLIGLSSDLHEKGECPPSGDDDYEIKDIGNGGYDLWSAPRMEDGNPADRECWTYIGGRAELHNSTQE